MKKFIFTLLLVSMLVTVVAVVAVSAAPPDTIDVDGDFYDLATLLDVGDIGGSIKLQDNKAGLHVTAKLDVDPGNVYTAWWVDTDSDSFGRAAGHVVQNGKFNWGANVPVETDEIHVINHGEKIPGIVNDMIHMPTAGCIVSGGDNACSVTFIVLP